MIIGLLNWRDIRHPKAGGAEEFLYRQALHWIAAGHRVKWCAASFPGAPSRATVEGIEIFRCGGEYSLYLVAPVMYALHLSDCDVIIDAENGIPFFTPLYSRKPKVLVMHHVHRHVLLTELPRPVNYIAWSLEAVLMPMVYRRVPFIAVSESTRKDVTRYGYTRQPITVVYNGVDHDGLHSGPKAMAPTVVYLGRVVRYKRIPRLIELFDRVRAHVPDAKLVIAGDGEDLGPCKERAAQLSLSTSVEFLGRISDARKSELLSSSWVFAQPSSVEGWGISVIEAAVCGTPSIAMRVPGLKDAIISGETGILVDSWDEFAEALVSVLTHGAMRERLAEGALGRSRDFSWKKSADATLEVLTDAMGRRS